MSKVFVIKEQVIRGDTGPTAMDYSAAMQYGELDFVTTHDMPLYGKSSVQDAWDKDVHRFVREYDSAHDFVVTTGQPTAIFSAGWALGAAGKIPRFLVWRREESRYRVVNFNGAVFLDFE